MITIDPAVLERLPHRKASSEAISKGRASWTRFLQPEDRLLYELAMQHRLPRRQVAAALGVAPGNVSRRLRRLINRLHDPLVVQLCASGCTLPDEHRQIGLEHFLHHRTLNDIARDRRQNPRRIRQMIEYIRGWHRGHSTRR